mmetsp:Transcript_30980/g.64449  ORF Transcript_30980/g.64449 Transcript_30980/m.64449 type:complete len:343 (+) Transcript_30980:99-1127(+)
MIVLPKHYRNAAILAIVILLSFDCVVVVEAFPVNRTFKVRPMMLSSDQRSGCIDGAAVRHCFSPMELSSFQRGGGHSTNGDFPLNRSLALFSRVSTHYYVQGTSLTTEEQKSNDSGTDAKEEKHNPTLKQDIRSFVTLLGTQAILIILSPLLSHFLRLPKLGLGSAFRMSPSAILSGLKWTMPLFGTASIMKFAQKHFHSIRDVNRSIQRSVLEVMGPVRRPIYSFVFSVLLGVIAGWGEEWLFRGVIQTFLRQNFGIFLALAVTGVVFGLLHSVTPMYAIIAGLASIFFGYLYHSTGNLAVPMVCHAIYDFGALMRTHWRVTGFSVEEQDDLIHGQASLAF